MQVSNTIVTFIVFVSTCVWHIHTCAHVCVHIAGPVYSARIRSHLHARGHAPICKQDVYSYACTHTTAMHIVYTMCTCAIVVVHCTHARTVHYGCSNCWYLFTRLSTCYVAITALHLVTLPRADCMIACSIWHLLYTAIAESFAQLVAGCRPTCKPTKWCSRATRLIQGGEGKKLPTERNFMKIHTNIKVLKGSTLNLTNEIK